MGKLRTYRSLSGFLLGLYFLIFASNTLFSHTHIVGSTVVVHSHLVFPIGDSSSSQHTHTAAQLLQIVQFQSQQFENCGDVLLPLFFATLIAIFLAANPGSYKHIYSLAPTGRAPPRFI